MNVFFFFKTEKTTLSYILQRCNLALDYVQQLTDRDLNSIQTTTVFEIQEIADEIEFEWIRQFWMQGEQHATLNTFWNYHISELEAQWMKLEKKVKLKFHPKYLISYWVLFSDT